mgnify:CR=1 FL=1
MDIHFIRKNPQLVKENQIKRYSDPNLVDLILNNDQYLGQLQFKTNKLRNLKNKLSESFKNASDNETINFDDSYTFDSFIEDINNDQKTFNELTKKQLSQLGKHINDMINDDDKLCKQLLMDRDQLISSLGNILHEDVIINDSEDNNKIIYETKISDNIEYKYSHNDLGKMLRIFDCESGIAISGNRGYFLTGIGVKLNMALINYAIDFLEERKYTLMQTPHIVTKELMSKITQLSEYEETLYKLDGHDKFLIATSEQPLTAYFNDKQINKKDLPIRFGGLSECYRKETGRHGSQTLGIFRVHQFQKVEQFCVTEPEKSQDMFNEMIKTSQDFYDSLGIEYRVVSIVSKALNNAASIKYDIEAYFHGSKFYGELVSCTNCLDYFSKRLNTKIIGTKQCVHMLNCTLMANTRVLCCLMEQYQTENGMKIPTVLQKYMNCDFIKFK